VESAAAKAKAKLRSALTPANAPKGVDTVIAAYDKLVSDGNGAIQKTLIAKFDVGLLEENRLLMASKSKASAQLAPISPALKNILLNDIKPRGTLDQPAAPAVPADPTIVQVTPAYGYNGDRITIRGKNLSLVAAQNEALFTPSASTVLSCKAVAATQGADGMVTLTVVIPNNGGVRAPYDGMVFVRVNDKNPMAVTNPLPFRTEAIPVITKVYPPEVSAKQTVTLTGVNFKPDDQVQVVMQNGSMVVIPKCYVNATTAMFKMPDYTSSASFYATVYIGTKTPTGGTITGTADVIHALPNAVQVTSIDRASGLVGTTVLITGKGFINPTVSFAATAGQSSAIYSGTASGAWYIVKWSETQIVATIPYYALLNSVNGAISVRSANSATPFTLPFTVLVQNTIECVKAPIVCVAFPKEGDSDHTWSDWYSPNSTWNTNVSVAHHSGVFLGGKGDDIFGIDLALKNGWRYHHVVFTPDNPESDGLATLEDVYMNSSGRYTARVHWWVDPSLTHLYYRLAYYIEGPKGVPYK